MTGWERVVVRDSDQKRYALIQPTGARAGNQMLQEYIADQTPMARPASIIIPYFRYFFVQSSPPAAKIQTAPLFPSIVIFGISISSSGQVRNARISCKIVQSSLTCFHHPFLHGFLQAFQCE